MIVIPWYVLVLFVAALVALSLPGLSSYLKLEKARALAGETALAIEFLNVKKELKVTQDKVKQLTESLDKERLLRQELEIRVEAQDEQIRGLSSDNVQLTVEKKHLQKLLINKWTGE